MSGPVPPWIVGVLVTLFVAVVGPAGLLVTRMQRRTNTSSEKLTATDQALEGFKALVADLQEERDALKLEKAEWRTERIVMQHDMAALRRENEALKRKGHAP